MKLRNYSSGSGGGYQEQQLAVINNIETLNYSFELPYLANPVFVIMFIIFWQTKSNFYRRPKPTKYQLC
jgi:hypothetical protein